MIYTGPLSALDYVMETHQPGYVISLLSPDMMIEQHPALSQKTHLRLSLNDISQERDGLVAPQAQHISDIINFIETWSTDKKSYEAPLYIHCYAGISRSPAATYMAMCLLNPDICEVKLARALRSINLAVSPNKMMIELADDIMGREGRMVQAIKTIGRGSDAWEGETFALPRYFPKPIGVMD